MIKKITYTSGQYSQFKLEDGTRLFLEALPDRVRISKLKFMVIPGQRVWEFVTPFYIRTSIEAWDLSKEILDLVLETVKDCKSLQELEETLKSNTTPLLENYVKDNEHRAYQMGIDKLGRFAAKKYLESSPMLRDSVAIPSDLMDIIGDFGKVMENVSGRSLTHYPALLYPKSLLPHPKEKIEKALREVLQIAKDEQFLNHLKVAQLTLSQFVDDEVAYKENNKLLSKKEYWDAVKRRKNLKT